MSVPYPRDLTIQENVGAAAATDDLSTIVGRMDRPATVNSVSYIPAANQSGAATNNRTLTLYNRGTAGSGTAVLARLTLSSGVNLSDNIPKTITLGSAADLSVGVGDVLEWESLHVNTGVADPGGMVIVTYAQR